MFICVEHEKSFITSGLDQHMRSLVRTFAVLRRYLSSAGTCPHFRLIKATVSYLWTYQFFAFPYDFCLSIPIFT